MEGAWLLSPPQEPFPVLGLRPRISALRTDLRSAPKTIHGYVIATNKGSAVRKKCRQYMRN